MWIFIFFDLPTESQKDKKEYTQFRKKILQFGFSMFQFSIYWKQLSTIESTLRDIKRVKRILPSMGHIGILRLTDAQCEKMLIYYEKKEIKVKKPIQQLEFF